MPAATLLLGRLAKGAFTAKPQDMPLLKEKLDAVLAQSGEPSNSHGYRETRALFNRFPSRELLYADVPSLKEIDRPHRLHVGRQRDRGHRGAGSGYVAVSIAFSDLRYSNKAEEDLRRALRRHSVRSLSTPGPTSASLRLLVFYFDDASLEHPIDVDKVREITEQVISTWEDRVGATLEQSFGPHRRPAPVQALRPHGDAQRPVSRVHAPRGSAGRSQAVREAGSASSRSASGPTASDSATLKMYSPRPMGLTETLRTLQNLACPSARRWRFRSSFPRGGRLPLAAAHRGAADIIRALIDGEERVRAALRALHEGRAADDPLNKLLMREGLGWRDIEVLRTLRNHLLQIRPVLNAETVNGVLLRNSKTSAALYHAFAARFDPAFQDDRDATIKATDETLRKAMRAVASLFDDEILRGLENLVRSTVRTNAYQRPERPVFAIKVDSARSRAWCRRGRCSKSTCIRGSSRASICAAARSRAAASAGATGTTISAPRSSA